MSKGRDDLGTLRKLAPDLRIMVYQLAVDDFDQTFDVCFPSYDFMLTTPDSYDDLPLSLRHNHPVVSNLMKVSNELCAEVLDSAFSMDSCRILMSEDQVNPNFPLTISHQEGERLNFDTALIPTCRELFIGIELPSPRDFVAISDLRLNMKKLVDLVNNIAARTKSSTSKYSFPQICVSFETDSYRAGLGYYRNDFEILVAPLYKLEIPPQDDAYNTHSALPIDRSCRWFTLDKRHETCCMIENAVQNPTQASDNLRFQQLSIDVRLDLALFASRNFGGEVSPRQWTKAMIKRLGVASKEVIAWNETKNYKVPVWATQLLSISEAELFNEELLNKLEDMAVDVVGLRGGRIVRAIENWTARILSSVNPFWKEKLAGRW